MGEWRAFWALVEDEQRSLDWLEEHEPGVVATLAAALNNERDLIEAVVQHASAEVAMQILFARADPETATELVQKVTPVIDWETVRTQYGDNKMKDTYKVIHSAIQTGTDPQGLCAARCREERNCDQYIDVQNPRYSPDRWHTCNDACTDTCKYYDCGDALPGSPKYQLCLGLVEARQRKTENASIDNFFSAENVLHIIDSNRANIEAASQQFGIPAELIAGILASEMFWDYNSGDRLQDEVISIQCSISTTIFTGNGPGLANPHETGYKPARDYLVGQGFNADMLDDIYSPCNLITEEGAVNAVGVIARYLMDEYGHGSNLTPEEMALAFAAYRQGPDGIADPDKGIDYPTWLEYYDLPGNGYYALPFMIYMSEKFG